MFELTDEGRAEAGAARERVGQGGPWAAAPTGAHFELRKGIKTLMLAARQVAVAGDEGQVAAAVAVVNQARQRIYRILAGDTGDTGDTGQTDTGQTDTGQADSGRADAGHDDPTA